MSLTPGTRVGVYEVVGLLGVGGMGEVHRARDTRLGRDVALKILPEAFAADADRLARFEREAHVLASLNHQNIAAIYGIEGHALVMELVDGEDLSALIARGPIAFADAVPLAKQIAAALEGAHAQGIIHRDLKPANIKVRADGTVKVLDFGLAKAMMPDAVSASAASAVSSPTITSPAQMTRAGIIIGTASYMAPEQARGKAVDQRADVWAFGCVLFEMLSGRRAFPGDEIADVLARVIQSEPDWQLLPKSTPRALTTLLQRCLRKDPARRIHSIADVRLDLEEIAVGGDQEAASVQTPARSRWAAMLAAAALGGAITAAGMLATGLLRSAAPAAPLLRYSIELPEGAALTRLGTTGRINMAISPDGENLAAVLLLNGRRRVFIRRLDETGFRELANTDDAQSVFWAPDSRHLAFATRNGLRRVDLSGLGSQFLATLPLYGWGAWGPADTILMATGAARPLYRLPAQGGPAEPIGVLPPGVRSRGVPSWLPGGQGFLFFDVTNPGQLSLMRAREGQEPQRIFDFESFGQGAASAVYQSGHLLLTATEPSGRTTLTAQPFDVAAGRFTGTRSVLVSDLNPAFSVSDTGVLVYGEGRLAGERFAWVDARGRLVSYASDMLRLSQFDLSPDERNVVMQDAAGGNGLSLHDLTRGATTRLNEYGVDPIWSPDGRQIAFAVVAAGRESGIHVMPAFGGPSRVLYAAKEQTFLDDWSRDGQWLAGHVRPQGPGILIPLAAGTSPIVFEDKVANIAVDETRFSPDGRWLAYGLLDGGDAEVFLTAVPPTGARWKVSVAGGAQPRWRADGQALYYLSLAGTMMTVDVQMRPDAAPQISAPRALFESGLQVTPAADQFAVNKDGSRFLLRRPIETSTSNQLHVVVNWPALLRAPKAGQ
jgi:hypothetical protein